MNNYKFIVCFLLTKFDNEKNLIEFMSNYKRYVSGKDHQLLICFKLLDNHTLKKYQNILKDIKYIQFIDNYEYNDYDLGSYKRIANKYKNYAILFLNSHSYPICNNWLLKLTNYFTDKTIIASSASNESMVDSVKFKKIYKFFSYLYRKWKFKKNFNSFPNPHIRTSGFLIKGEHYYNFIKDKKIYCKEDSWYLEAGKKGITTYFKSKKFNIYVVNSDGNFFTEKNWKFSETYNYKDQNKNIISDKHTRKYSESNFEKKIYYQKITWGK
jgi:hypothetical protein